MEKFKCRNCGYKISISDKDCKKLHKHSDAINDIKGLIHDNNAHYINMFNIVDVMVYCCDKHDFMSDNDTKIN